ncbi:Zn-finger protein [Rhizoctonia solani]|uniref:Zn-finger protein n=1 Tax=Rhizoctonia solani TaxID=456999 RepID=A0A8H7LN89_9AGAM|nr:Zn-finger protein [Rhizoctonia solani]
MRTGLTNAARDIHLQSPLYVGRTPWKNNKQLLEDIDKLLHGPSWHIYEMVTGGDPKSRTSFLFGRDILDAIRDLIGNPRFRAHVRYAPERHYTTKDKTTRLYGEMWSANWWWRMQMLIQVHDKFATIIPLIVFTDKTNLTTVAGGIQAYPVMVSIGNISKDIRRKPSMHATVLLGYLPVEEFKDVGDEKLRQRLKGELRHRAMEKLLEPLKKASKEGVLMWCADGRQRRAYPILAAYIGDSPEQHDMACSVRSGCPVCTTLKENRGTYPQNAPLRQKSEVLLTIQKWKDGLLSTDKLREHGLKPWWPFWANLPYVNLGDCLTPDLLHQLYKGLFWTHLMEWIKEPELLGKSADARFKSMPRAHGMRHFTRGIYSISQWTGRETKEMLKQFLPVVADDLVDKLVGLTRSLLDFIYYAHSAQLSEIEVQEMVVSLARFHELKGIAEDLGLEKNGWSNETIKLHMLSHYERSIHEYGTPDGYNSETSEYLHIEFAKTPFKKTNKNRSYMQQIIRFIQRQEAIQLHRACLEDLHGQFAPVPTVDSSGDDLDDNPGEGDNVDGMGNNLNEGVWGVEDNTETEADVDIEGSDAEVEDLGDDLLKMNLAKEPVARLQAVFYPQPKQALPSHPTREGVTGLELINLYGASDLIQLTSRLLEKHNYRQPLNSANTFSVYHKLYLDHPPLPFAASEAPQRDVIRAYPATKTTRGHVKRIEQFDTVLFLDQPENFGIYRYRAGRVRLIFTLPPHVHSVFPQHLAYVELFTPFGKANDIHGMHTTSHLQFEGKRRAALIPVTDIALACHLAPRFKSLPEDTVLTSRSDLLDEGTKFYLNHYHAHHTRQLIEYWRHLKPV